MKFARWVFTIAGIYGVLILAPLFFMEKTIGLQDPPPITHPMFFYGFAGAGLAWQIAFLVIGRNPVRFRPMMLVALVEKIPYGVSGIVLYLQHRMHAPADLGFACIDLVWAALFVAAYFKTTAQAG
jgi:hypothetical protein